MTDNQVTIGSHYIPRSLLANWASPDQKIYVYRLLVSHERVPIWKRQSTKSAATQHYLYTRPTPGGESDEIERWLHQTIETPAEEPIRKAIAGKRLNPGDWRRLARFVGAQHLRTPATMRQIYDRAIEFMNRTSSAEIAEWIRERTLRRRAGETAPESTRTDAEDAVLSVRLTKVEDDDLAEFRVYAASPRKFLHVEMPRLFEQHVQILEQHRWRILTFPPSVPLIIPDNPFVCLNYVDAAHYDLQGGWNNPGTELLFPLSPRHLLYTSVGKKHYETSSKLSVRLATALRKILAQNAERFIYASEPIPEIERLRPRLVDREAYKKESAQMERWHQEQSQIEDEFRRLSMQSNVDDSLGSAE